jgi:KDO2-lipid IV(A) lauroyltransferase
MKQIFWIFEFLLIILFTLPLAIIPYRISLKIGEALGVIVFSVWKSRREIALENLTGAISRNSIQTSSDPESIIKQNFGNLGKSLVEIVKINYGLGNQIINHVEIIGIENYEKIREKGNGIVPIIGHCGNWELMAIALSKKLTKINVIARPQNNLYVNRIIERTREKYGNHIIYKKGALKNIFSSLKRNEVVGILMDQSVVKAEGVIIEFLGKKASTMKIPALIARKTGATVLPAFIRRTNGGHIIEIGEEVELDKSPDLDTAVLNDTINFTSYIEEYIRQNPAEWLWMHRRWKSVME